MQVFNKYKFQTIESHSRAVKFDWQLFQQHHCHACFFFYNNNNNILPEGTIFEAVSRHCRSLWWLIQSFAVWFRIWTKDENHVFLCDKERSVISAIRLWSDCLAVSWKRKTLIVSQGIFAFHHNFRMFYKFFVGGCSPSDLIFKNADISACFSCRQQEVWVCSSPFK